MIYYYNLHLHEIDLRIPYTTDLPDYLVFLGYCFCNDDSYHPFSPRNDVHGVVIVRVKIGEVVTALSVQLIIASLVTTELVIPRISNFILSL